jgi:choline dehydrogenase-like flavoprotein
MPYSTSISPAASGSANPTLTIVALALRLAAHLQQRLTA